MNCKTATKTNGSESILMEKLNEIHGNEFKAAQAYAYFDNASESFVEEFGDYVKAYGKNDISFNDRLDDNGEPKLFYDETAQKHYFLDKNYNKTFYPLINRGLRGIFSYKQIEKITSRLANNYLKQINLNYFNVDDLEEEGKTLPNLNLYIKKEIENKIVELNKQGIKGKISAKSLEKSLAHLNEYVDNIDSLYKKMSLVRKDTEEADSYELNGEEVKDPSFAKSSFEKDSKDSIPNSIKLKLSLLENPYDKDPIWNEPTFVPFNDVYGTIINALANQVALEGEDLFDIYLDKISKAAIKKPYLKALVADLKSNKFTENDKNQFVRSFNLHSNNFLVSEIKTKVKGEENKVVKGYVHDVKEISESGSKASIVLSEWGNNFKNLFVGDNNAIKKDAVAELNEIVKDIKDIQALVKNDMSKNEFEDVNQKYIEHLRKLGVELTEEGFSNFLDSEGDSLFNFGKQIISLNNSLVQTEKAIQKAIKELKSPKDSFRNPFLAEGLFKKLGKAEAYFSAEGSDSSIWSGGKNKWLFSYPSYLSTKILQWKKNPQLLKDLYNQSSYNRGSALMEYLLGLDIDKNMQYLGSLEEAQNELSKERLDQFRLGIFNMFQEVDGEALNASDLSLKDYFNDHIHKVLTNGYSRTTTPADKGSDMQLKTGFFIDSFSHKESHGKVIFTEKVHDMFFNYFNSEVNRMKEAEKEVEAFKGSPENLTIHYHYKDGSKPDARNGNAFQSQYFPELSFNSESTNPLVKEIKDILYDKTGKVKHTADLASNNEAKRLIRNYINTLLNEGFNDTYSTFLQQELIVFNSKGEVDVNNVSNLLLKKYLQENAENKEEAINAMVADYYINSLSQNIEYSKMFTGDVAFYKNMVDYKKRVPATYTDGLQLRVTKGNEFFNVAVIESVNIESPAYSKLVKMIGDEGAKPYQRVNSADAQAWITPKRWKFLLNSLGKWTDLHDSVYAKMTSDEPQEYTKEELKVAAQPLKGVYFYLNGKTPTFLKYSQAVLTKNMVSGSPGLEAISKAMNSQNVDELLTLDAFKVGSPTPTKLHDEKGNIIDSDSIKFNVKQLTNYGWKLQQDLPVKTLKQTDVGSQIQKNIFGGLKYNSQLAGFELDGKQTNGQTIINGITNITGGLVAKGFDDIRNQFGIDKNGKIRNVKSFYNALVVELERRGGSKNIIDALNKETALYGIPQAMDKITNVFSSIMNDRLVKIKSNGGSFIQMSNFGISKKEGSDKGAVWNPTIENGATTMEPEMITVDGKVKIKPGQVLISGSFLAKYIPNWRKYSPEELFISYKGGDPIIGKEIQENVIGYRIPNQGLSSNDALQIIGILPEENGDTIVAYTGITTKTGSDFDIDKMYIMMANYNLSEEGRLEYAKYDPSKKNYDQSKEALQNRLIELYKSVLTHRKVIKNVMKPVDIEFIKNDIEDLVPNDTSGILFHFDAFKDITLRYEFVNGKAGVGQEANALVDINRMGEISLNKYYVGWGNQNNVKDTEFDQEFSEDLSEKDLQEYIKDINPSGSKDSKAIIREIKKVRIADSLTAILNAFVDIAKDPYITRGNWTTSTTNTGNLLLRAGVHPLYVTAFMAQPIIKQYVEYQAGRESIISKDTGDIQGKFRRQLVIDNLKNKSIEGINLDTIYQKVFRNQNVEVSVLSKEDTFKNIRKAIGKNELTDENIKDIRDLLEEEHQSIFNSKPINITNKEEFSLKHFRDQIKVKSSGSFQIAVLEKFFELQEISKAVKENVDISKLDTNGMGKNINTLFSIFNLRQNVLDKEATGKRAVLNGFESKLQGTVLGKYYDAMTKILKIVRSNPKLFPQAQDNVQIMFNEISQDLYGNPAIDGELLTDLEKSYHTYVMSHFPAFNLDKTEIRTLLNRIPRSVRELKKSSKGKYLIIDELEVKDDGKFKLVGLNNRKKAPDFEDKLTDSWRDLRVDNPELAEDLIKYSFLTSGFKMNASQFYTYIPNEYLIQEGINKFVNVFTKENQFDFIDKFYLNNSFKNKYVRNVFDNEFTSENIVTGFTMKDPGKSRYYVKRNNGAVYKLAGYNEENKAAYIRAKKLGYKTKGAHVVEYGSEFTDDFAEIDNKFKSALQASVVSDREKFDPKFVLREVEDSVDEEETTVELSEPTIESPKEIEVREDVNTLEGVKSMSELTNHSGGAYGADTAWDQIGREFGVVNQMHYRDVGNEKLSQTLKNKKVEATVLSKEQMNAARSEVEKLLGKKYPDTLQGNLQVRNYYQVINSDAVFAVAKLNIIENKVLGGTNTAVQLGLKLNKPTYVWDINTKKWYLNNGFIFEEIETPILTKNFAGVGTRDIENYSVPSKENKLMWVSRQEYVGDKNAALALQAMKDVYQKTQDFINASNDFKVESKPAEVKITRGQFVKYNNETYLVTKENDNGTVQIYNPKLKGVNSKKSVSKQKLISLSQTAKVVSYQGVDYMVTPGNTIISTVSNTMMNWGENDGNRKAILALANGGILAKDLVNIGEVTNRYQEAPEGSEIFRPANNEQKVAIEKIQDFIENGNPQEIFILEGKAGTGKTTIVQEAISKSIANNKKVLIGALSHKAKLVLANKLDKRFPSRVASGSVASILGMTMDLETGEFVRNDFLEAPIEFAEIIIIDEASMINEEALALIMEHKRRNAKVIFLGDRGQLPPIRKYSSDAISVVFDSPNKASLTERVRQGEESPILPFADYYWDNSEKVKSELDPVPEEAKKDVVTDKGSLVFASSLGDIFDEVSGYFKIGVNNQDPNFIKIVTYRNATRQAYNQRIRKEVFGEDAPQFVKNDIIMFQNNYKSVDNDFSNSDEFSIETITESVDGGYKIFNIGVDVKGKIAKFSVLNSEDKSKFDKDVAQLFSRAKEMPRGNMRSQAYKDAWALKNKFADIDYAYAITSHKSQGSTYDNVIVDIKDINGVSATSSKSKSRSIYTALTRAKTNSIVIAAKVQTNTKNISKALSNSISEDTLKINTFDSNLKSIKEAFEMDKSFFEKNGISSVEQIEAMNEQEQKEFLRKYCIG